MAFHLFGGLIKVAVQRSAIIAAALHRKLDMEGPPSTTKRTCPDRGMVTAADRRW